MLWSHSKWRRNIFSDRRTLLVINVIVLCSCLMIGHYGAVSGQDDQCTFDLSRNLSSPSFHGTIVRPSLSGPLSSSGRTCEWFLDKEANRTFVLRVDSVRFVNRSSLTIIIDDNITELTEDCFNGNCLRTDIYGHSLRIIWNEFPSISSAFSLDNRTDGGDNNGTAISHFPFAFHNTNDTNPPAFSIRYVVVGSVRCEIPDDVENADVDHGGSIAVGEWIRYRCIPYHSTKDSDRVVDVKCVLNFDLPLEPSWSKPLPVCHRERCRKNKEVSIVRLDTDRTRVIAYDGHPLRDETCRWEVESIGTRAIHVQLDWFDLPERGNVGAFPSLEFYDGEVRERRLLVRLNKGTGSFGFISIRGKVAVILKGDGTKGAKNDTYEFYVKFTSLSPRCKIPIVPKNGDVRGSEVSYVDDIAVIYACNEGYRLVGSNRSECLDSGSWSPPPPVCESDVVLSKETGSDFVDSGKSVAKVPQLRPKKIHPQSTEEKNGRKSGFIGKEDLKPQTEDVKPQPEDPKPQSEVPIVGTTTEPLAVGTRMEEEPSFSGEPDTNFGIGDDVKDYEDALSGYSEIDEYSDEGLRLLEEDGTVSDGDGSGQDGPNGFPVVAIAIAITLPLLACTVIAISCIVYRKLYPVRMFPGRKFETFENPIYGSSKRSNSTAETSAALLPTSSGLARSPAELERLTIHASP